MEFPRVVSVDTPAEIHGRLDDRGGSWWTLKCVEIAGRDEYFAPADADVHRRRYGDGRAHSRFRRRCAMAAMVLAARRAALVGIVTLAHIASGRAARVIARRSGVREIEREDGYERDAKHRDPAFPVDQLRIRHESLLRPTALTNPYLNR